ncbi:helicase-related protein [Clostridium sp. C8-1-8]|uniref:DEAD/DEAH box helicase family protein n=1 Tax=Clostridium sp. C8-1-8 TaxID=2698831 RepID=UPI00136D3696|nr:helicase-related protein [Clostridium sp. C8-1-8]
METEKKNYNIVANYLTEEYIKRISGEDVSDILIGDNPKDRVMVGMLAAERVRKSYGGDYIENDENKYESIPSIGMSFIIDNNSKGNLFVKPLGFLYYKIKPNFNDFEEHTLRIYSQKYRIQFDNLHHLELYIKENEVSDKIKLLPFYKKVTLDKYFDEPIKINIEKLKKEKTISLKEEIDEHLSILVEEIKSESIFINDNFFKIGDISSEYKFNSIVLNKQYESAFPAWNIDITLQLSESDDGDRVTVTYVNLSEERSELVDGTYSPHIFNARLSVKGDENVNFKDIELDYFIDDYRQDVCVKAIPENASIKYNEVENYLITENIPIYYQNRLITRDEFSSNTSFEVLIKEPIKNLQFIFNKMQEDLIKVTEKYKSDRNSGKFSSIALDNYKKDLEGYKREINRFEDGINIIKTNDISYRAFVYMNETFKTKLYNGQKVVPGWRLFQLVFIVSLINDIVISEFENNNNFGIEELEIADLLYFPTGGGKTEAFLGAVVFTMFFDRLRGKNDGVSAFIKYPLRLLSINQLDRILITICKAEFVRKKYSIGLNEFSTGYFVGSNNTPNRIKDKGNFIEKTQEDLNEQYRLIDTCPVCGDKKINVRFDEDSWRLVHYCDNDKCSLAELPLCMVDNEIYRYMPTVIVSTVDKLAGIGLNSAFKTLFGQVKAKCPKHGYSHRGKCIESDNAKCQCKLVPVKDLKDPVPTLFIQDELHLVRESLGTFASHYISFIKYYCEKLVPESQRKRIKFIGATATISMFQEQIWNLYHMDGRRFPTQYPAKEGNFYSIIDHEDVSRIIMGYAPYGRSVTNAVWESTTNLRMIIHDIIKDLDKGLEILKEKGFEGNTDKLLEVLNNYWVSINYNNTKQDGIELYNAFQNQANNLLNDRGINEFNIDQMTGDDGFQKVRQVLFEIQSTKDKTNCTNLVLATSTISHGVDEDSFNQMFFFGMPNNTAEYVQAYSRVGRKYTGIVIDIIRLMRERDRSYLKNFNLFHENKDSLIDAVPINRWAKNAIYSTLPGILAALIIQYYEFTSDKSYLRAVELQNIIKEEKIDVEDAVTILVNSYGCNDSEKSSWIYRDVIKEEISRIMNAFKEIETRDKFLGDCIGMLSRYGKKPMSSLRDTEEQIEIKIR